MTIKKAIRHNIDIKPKWKIRKRLLDKSTNSSGLLSRVDEIISLPPKYKTKKNFVNSALEITGLLNKKKKKVSNLTPVEKLLFSLSRALLKSAEIIMFSIPQDKFQKVKIEQFNRYMDNIKRRFHVILIMHGEKEIVSQCDQILTVVGNSVEVGSINEYISRIPHSGDIITIELNNPNEKVLKELINIESSIFLTERINEKYKIFSKEDPDKIIQKIIQLAGPYLYSFNKRKANFGEYVLFKKSLTS
jgi:ABC-type multidrug transport system ATPase subunit